MDVKPAETGGRLVIDGYGDGGFSVSGQRHEGALLVLPDAVEPWEAPEDGSMAALTPEAVAAVVARGAELDILLVGCGAQMALIPKAVQEALKQVEVVAETMTTSAACRTYNVLALEGRRVAALLVPV